MRRRLLKKRLRALESELERLTAPQPDGSVILPCGLEDEILGLKLRLVRLPRKSTRRHPKRSG